MYIAKCMVLDLSSQLQSGHQCIVYSDKRSVVLCIVAAAEPQRGGLCFVTVTRDESEQWRKVGGERGSSTSLFDAPKEPFIRATL